MIIFAPSNPIVSIGAILAVPGIREAIEKSSAYKLAVSPLINGATVKGPADKMMTSSGFSCDVFGVAECYQGLIDGLVIDQQDSQHEAALLDQGLNVLVTDTLMHSRQSKVDVAESIMAFFKSAPASVSETNLSEVYS